MPCVTPGITRCILLPRSVNTPLPPTPRLSAKVPKDVSTQPAGHLPPSHQGSERRISRIALYKFPNVPPYLFARRAYLFRAQGWIGGVCQCYPGLAYRGEFSLKGIYNRSDPSRFYRLYTPFRGGHLPSSVPRVGPTPQPRELPVQPWALNMYALRAKRRAQPFVCLTPKKT